MPECGAIDPLVTRYVDGDLDPADRAAVDAHLHRCPPCKTRVAAEQSVRELLHERQAALRGTCAPNALRAACALRAAAERAPSAPVQEHTRRSAWRAGLAPLAAAAALVLTVGGAFLYQATGRSSRLLAAELATDHLKCLTMNAVVGMDHSAQTVEQAMASGFGWQMRLPATGQELDLVGSRPCLYARGKIAHIMYRHEGQPVSLYMLPGTERPEQMVAALGYQCAIWSDNNRTFVLVARAASSEVQRLAALLHDAIR